MVKGFEKFVGKIFQDSQNVRIMFGDRGEGLRWGRESEELRMKGVIDVVRVWMIKD